MKICFMGSMDFAVTILEKLDEKYGVDLVVTQPDKPFGRKQVLKGTAVKEKALLLGIETFQPENIKRDYQRIIDSDFDFIIVAAYGQIIPDRVLNHGRYQAINVHASLLPKYRGGTPMHRAIVNGDTQTGVSIMYMVKKMDAGPILDQAMVDIEINDDVASLELKLAKIGANLLIQNIEELIKINKIAKEQDTNLVSYAYHILPEETVIDFNQTAKACYDQVRGMHPWPIAKILVKKYKIKIYQADFKEENKSTQPGEIVEINKEGIFIQTKEGLFVLKEIQLQGKKRMNVQAFMNGVGKDIFCLNDVI